MLMRPATLLRLWSLRKNDRGGRGAVIFVEQLHPFITINYPSEELLASEVTSSFPLYLALSCRQYPPAPVLPRLLRRRPARPVTPD
jgi:hypothetical protein